MFSHVCNVLLANRDQPSAAYADVQPTGVATFTLVDAENDRTIQEILGGDIINADVFATHPLTIRAAVEGPVDSVHLALTESQFAVRTARTDNVAPYAVHTDDEANDYAGVVLPAGEYYVSATAYTTADPGGDAAPTYTIRFSITAEYPITVPISPSDPPSASQAALSASGSIILAWEEPATDASSVTGYQILRRSVRNTGNLEVYVHDTGTTATTYEDSPMP